MPGSQVQIGGRDARARRRPSARRYRWARDRACAPNKSRAGRSRARPCRPRSCARLAAPRRRRAWSRARRESERRRLIVTPAAAIVLPSCPTRNDAPLYSDGPEAAPTIDRIKPAAMSGSKTTGARVVLILRAPEPAQCALGGSYSDRLRIFELSEAAVRRVPESLLHRVAVLRDRRYDEAVRSARILAGETLAVREHHPVAPRTEFGALGILDSRIESQRRILGRCALFRALDRHLRFRYRDRPIESSGSDFGCSAGSGNPAHGSAADRRASSTVLATNAPSESRSSSAVEEVADDCPQKTRKPSRRSRELLSFSTSPMRTPAAERLRADAQHFRRVRALALGLVEHPVGESRDSIVAIRFFSLSI